MTLTEFVPAYLHTIVGFAAQLTLTVVGLFLLNSREGFLRRCVGTILITWAGILLSILLG